LANSNEGLEARRVRDPQHNPEGFYLEFRMPRGAEKIVEKLEDRRQQIELLSMIDRGQDGISATVFVPMQAEQYLLKKIEKYRIEEPHHDQQRKPGKPLKVDDPRMRRLLPGSIRLRWELFTPS